MMKKGIRFKVFSGTMVLAILVCAFMAYAALAGKPDWWSEQEHLSDRIAETQIPAVPYPEDKMKVSLERKNLRERLLRFNKPDKIGYVYLLNYGKYVGYYVIKGKISSTQSQMTNTTQTWNGSGSSDAATVGSIGDDGSFGDNEGGPDGIFFFTANGTLVETVTDWVYSDAPLPIDVPNLGKRR